MLRKIIELKKMLKKAGFVLVRTRGSHTTWKHHLLTKNVVLSGNNGRDAKPYQEREVEEALRGAAQNP